MDHVSYAGGKVLPFYLDKTEVSLQSIADNNAHEFRGWS